MDKSSLLYFIPRQLIREREIELDQRIFPITYPAARMIIKKAGNLVGIHIRPHELRRHAATYASKVGTPIEIVSKVILRLPNSRQLSDTLEKLVTQKPCDRLKISMDKETPG
jgi:hypothetical protein